MAEYIDLDQCASGGGGGGADPVGLKDIAQNAIDPAIKGNQDTIITNQGAAGTAAPFGTGILGWLRGIYDKLTQFSFTSGDLDVNISSGAVNVNLDAIKDATNSTNTVPTTGSPYTGTGIDVTKYSFITVSILYEAGTAHTGTLFMEFSADNTNWVAVDGGISVLASATTSLSRFNPRTLSQINSFFRVRYVPDDNNLTTFQLETRLAFLQNAKLTGRLDADIDAQVDVEIVRSIVAGQTVTGEFVNQSVSSAGNAHVALFDPQSGFPSIVDPNGSLKTAEVIVLSGSVLDGRDLSDIFWKELSINGGSMAGGEGEMILSTGTTANGEYILQTARAARFMITLFNINHIGIQLIQADLEDPDTIFEWGSVDFINEAGTLNATPNGIFLRVTGAVPPIDPTWEIVAVKNGVETTVDSTNFNGPQASLLNKRPDLSVYETRYNAGGALLYQGLNFLHRASGSVETYAATYDFPVAIRVRNINGNTTNRSVATRALGTYRLGEERGELISRTFTSDTLIKTGSGYAGTMLLSRNGSGGGSGTAELFDGIDDTGISMGLIDIGGDDAKPASINSTYIAGLFIKITGSGTNTVTINFE